MPILPALALAALLPAVPPAAPSPVAAPPSVRAQDSAPGPRALVVVRRGAVPGATAAALAARGFDVASHTVVDGRIELIADAAEQAELDALGIPYTVEVADLEAFYAARLSGGQPLAGGTLGSFLSPPFGQGSMGGYYTFPELEGVLDQIAAAYPDITTAKFSLGTTGQGRQLWALKVSDSPDVDEAEPEVRFDAMHHAREPQSMMCTLWTLLYLVENYGTDPLATYLVDNREIWFVPCVNPDGYEYNRQIAPNGGGLWRKNRRNNGGGAFGVDLNRNYSFQWGPSQGSSGDPNSDTYRGPSAASEPEVQAMQAFIDSRDFVTAMSAHTYSNVWLYPWGYTPSGPANEAEYQEISALQTAVNNYVYGPASIVLYLANGVTFDYDHGVHGTLGWTAEIGSSSDGFWPATARIVPLAQENELAFLRTAQAAGAFLNVTDLDRAEVGDGDGLFEAGEAVEWRYALRNSGKGAPSTSVVLGLSSSSQYATVTVGSVDLGAVAPFSDADNATAPLTLVLDAATPSGTVVPYTTTVAYEGYVESVAGSVIVGAPRTLIADDVEVELGWTLGVPSDDATTGLWEWGPPVGTSSGGDPVNPGSDNTPPPGVACYTTGNGSTSSGGDDVDGGTTTLVSPRFHLADLGSAVVRYARWYANTGNSPDDTAYLQVSDDDGATWVDVEAITGNQNAWQEQSFVLTDLVDATDEVRLRFVASDLGNGSLVEAALDDVRVETYDAAPRIAVYGRPAIGRPVTVNLTAAPGGSYALLYSFAPASIDVPAVSGTILVDPTQAAVLASGAVPAEGAVHAAVDVPNDGGLVGVQLWFQGVRFGGGIVVSNDDTVVFE